MPRCHVFMLLCHVYRKVEKERWRHVQGSAIRVTCQIRSLLHECNASIQQPSAAFTEVRTVNHRYLYTPPPNPLPRLQ